ncbi:alpha-mannosidase [Sediminibacillus halophilus]|uniref:alpha-mannosidase n=1 Tax=Sediminibacillus halophilus TaxID=482461 RepID=A0A1G9U863_9BACI|nr:alpha-mannosidase [Sediminibacillus halophilus]SDM56068.1 alpha-mannosidase [Sediminibacillus halophilus]
MRRIERLIRYLTDYQYSRLVTIDAWELRRAVYEKPGQYHNLESGMVKKGEWLVDSGTTVFLKTTVNIPGDWKKEELGFIFRSEGKGGPSYCESLVSFNGEPVQGLDRNKNFVTIPSSAVTKDCFSVEMELFNPEAIPDDKLRGFNQVAKAETEPPPVYFHDSSIVRVNRSIQSLLFTLETHYAAALLLPDSDPRRSLWLNEMETIVEAVGIPDKKQLTDETWRNYEESLINAAQKFSGYREGTIRAIGQSHIDLAWLWPMKETVRKASRTFSSMCTLLDEYDTFRFAQSQPQLFAFLKEHHPKIFERVSQKIKNERMELIGGMWVEPDLNIPSGESLVRQLLYGKKFYNSEFGQESRVEWLPDTFGYCASLPQILKKAGTDYFMTTKLNWNDTNRFPHDLFYWEGIDGTKILSYLHTILGQETYPKEIKNTWEDFKQIQQYPERMLVYGYGDGGGGVTREMVERLERTRSLPGLPDVEFDTVHGFFDRIDQQKPPLPVWYGDLYLELHRGTYTTHAEAKKSNRQAEVLYREAEVWNSLAYMIYGYDYPTEKLEEGWKLLLLNQFHDIVPGTSIESVYDLSTQHYDQIFYIGDELNRQATEYLSTSIDTEGPGRPLVLFNSLSWKRDGLITLSDGKKLADTVVCGKDGSVYEMDLLAGEDGNDTLIARVPDIPELGYTTVWLQERSVEETVTPENRDEFEGKWETAFFKVEFTSEGWMSRLYDKQADKEIIKPGNIANELQLFDDLPTDWDAWDIDPYYENQPVKNSQLKKMDITHKGNIFDQLTFQWEINDSFVTQKVTFYHHDKRIDFKTEVDWQEKHKLLKVAFPVNIHSRKASYEIPFGSVERATHNNTSWEQAQYEVCGQRWADLSEGNYGVSLLNDSKYGYDIKDNCIRLSLLRAPKWPDETADIGTHTFTYSLFAHEGDWRKAKTVHAGYELNNPVTIVNAANHKGDLPSSQSYMKVKSDTVIIDTIKKAEEAEGLIVRTYEATGSEAEILMENQFPVRRMTEVNLLESKLDSMEESNGRLEQKLSPYEISTVLLLK